MTWSILFHERDSGRIAIAVATKFFAVGARVPFIEPLKGGLCTQALLNPLYGPDGLNLIRAGASAGQVVKTLTEADAGRAHRQLHVLGADGKFAAYTGAECVPWCGHTIEQDFSVAGNMLAGPQVLQETARAFMAAQGLPLAQRLILGMQAGERVGGDKRGKQSAALCIHADEDYLQLDIRVDDHEEPLLELQRLYDKSLERFQPFLSCLPGRHSPSGITERSVIEARIAERLARLRGQDEQAGGK